MQKWLNVEENITNGYESARPAPRACPTELSKEMKHKSKGEITPTIFQESKLRKYPVSCVPLFSGDIGVQQLKMSQNFS